MVDEPTPEELEAHAAEGGPAMAARRWLELVVGDGDIDEAWPRTDPNFRLALVQNQIWANRAQPGLAGVDLDALAAALAVEEPDSPAWPPMRVGVLRILDDFYEGVDLDALLFALPTQPVDPDHELVLLVDPDTSHVTSPGQMTFSQGATILMSARDDRWHVAGFTDRPPRPGWPPDWPEQRRIDL